MPGDVPVSGEALVAVWAYGKGLLFLYDYFCLLPIYEVRDPLRRVFSLNVHTQALWVELQAAYWALDVRVYHSGQYYLNAGSPD